MAERIMQSDEEEYDAKQPPVKKEDGLKAKAERYKEEINNIDDEKLLSYIMDCCSAKRQMMGAEERLEEKNPDKGDKIEPMEA